MGGRKDPPPSLDVWGLSNLSQFFYVHLVVVFCYNTGICFEFVPLKLFHKVKPTW